MVKKKKVFRTVKEFEEMFFPKHRQRQTPVPPAMEKILDSIHEDIRGEAGEIGKKLAQESLDMIKEAMREEQVNE